MVLPQLYGEGCALPCYRSGRSSHDALKPLPQFRRWLFRIEVDLLLLDPTVIVDVLEGEEDAGPQ